MTGPIIRRRWLLVLLACLPALAAPAPVVTQSGTYMVPMRDGTKLATAVYLPNGPGPWPVLLARTPYNKDGIKPPGGLPLAMVVQDVRGRFGSEGRNVAFEPDGWGERRDGYDTCAWLVSQPWCNGKIGTIGGSAVGITQVLAAGAEAPGIVCQSIDVAPGNLMAVCYEGGAWQTSLIEGWLTAAMWARENLTEWQAHPTYDEYWAQGDALAVAERTTPAGLFCGGWYDIFSRGTVEIFLARNERGAPTARGHQRLVMGPWGHGRGTKVGELTFPDNAAGLPAAFRDFAWERHWLFGEANGVDRTPAVTYYLMGDTTNADAPGNTWRTSPTWPPPESEPEPWRAAAGEALVPGPARGDLALTYTFDPANPVPTVGGRNLLIAAGPADQRSIEERPDVLLFTSETLEAPYAVAGDVSVALEVASSARDTDFTAKLTDVYPDGRSMLVCDGIRRMRFRNGPRREEFLEPGRRYEVSIDLGPVALAFAPGHQIRLAISSSSYPKYQANRNTGGPMFGDEAMRKADNTVHSAVLLLPAIDLEGEGG